MDLHYSQTNYSIIFTHSQFHYLMDLHYSQTPTYLPGVRACFTTLWIYTILKPANTTEPTITVSLPYGFTLFSNDKHNPSQLLQFHYLMDLHYSQTYYHTHINNKWFHYLMDLHYSQTPASGRQFCFLFHYLMDLHYSQTRSSAEAHLPQFHYLMDLHYSQTLDLFTTTQ